MNQSRLTTVPANPLRRFQTPIIHAALVTALLLLGVGTPRQATAQDVTPWDILPGLFELEDGRLMSVFDLVDRLPDNQLVAVEPGSGRVRTLYPDSTEHCAFRAGSGWFARTPAAYSLRFSCGEEEVDRLVLEEDGRRLQGERVRLPERNIVFESGDVRLAGTLVLPQGPGPHPAVVMVHGSGPVTRAGPRYMAELLAHRGVAALIYDKRGAGESTGNWRTATYGDLADDVSAALAHLQAENDIDSTRLGLFGASEAGYVLPIVAAREPVVSVVACRVCPGEAQYHIAPILQRYVLDLQGYPPDEVEEGVRFHVALIDFAINGTGYAALLDSFDRFGERAWLQRYGFDRLPSPDDAYWRRLADGHVMDPAAHYARLQIPVLIVLGEFDDRIPFEASRAALLAAAGPQGNPLIRVEVMPGADHGMMEVRLDEDGQSLAPVRYAPAFHALVVNWIAAQFFDPE